jgi:hypothetical protein
MGWEIGYDNKYKRDIGYGVPAICDHPDCNEEIDRGLGYVCGEDAYGGDEGCGLFFCSGHSYTNDNGVRVCERCLNNKEEFEPKPDIDKWMHWKLDNESWKNWRIENPKEVEKIKKILNKTD